MDQKFSDDQIINAKTINELKKYVQTHELLEIYKEFEIETFNAFKELKTLFKAQNYEEILIILHTVKGNAATLGLISIASLCEHMELELRGSETPNLNQDFSQLISLFNNFVSNYERILNQH